MTVAVYPERKPAPDSKPIKDHWARVFSWTHFIVSKFKGLPWDNATKNLKLRAFATSKHLLPMLEECLSLSLNKRQQLFGDKPELFGNGVSIGLSKVRLLPMTVGLTEQPSDRRPYTVISISPDACKSTKNLYYVVMHECVHLATAVRGGNPHNEDFQQLADSLGIPRKHQN
jgi:hypothetical protein